MEHAVTAYLECQRLGAEATAADKAWKAALHTAMLAQLDACRTEYGTSLKDYVNAVRSAGGIWLE